MKLAPISSLLVAAASGMPLDWEVPDIPNPFMPDPPDGIFPSTLDAFTLLKMALNKCFAEKAASEGGIPLPLNAPCQAVQADVERCFADSGETTMDACTQCIITHAAGGYGEPDWDWSLIPIDLIIDSITACDEQGEACAPCSAEMENYEECFLNYFEAKGCFDPPAEEGCTAGEASAQDPCRMHQTAVEDCFGDETSMQACSECMKSSVAAEFATGETEHDLIQNAIDLNHASMEACGATPGKACSACYDKMEIYESCFVSNVVTPIFS